MTRWRCAPVAATSLGGNKAPSQQAGQHDHLEIERWSSFLRHRFSLSAFGSAAEERKQGTSGRHHHICIRHLCKYSVGLADVQAPLYDMIFIGISRLRYLPNTKVGTQNRAKKALSIGRERKVSVLRMPNASRVMYNARLDTRRAVEED